jgi:hypothetical protein
MCVGNGIKCAIWINGNETEEFNAVIKNRNQGSCRIKFHGNTKFYLKVDISEHTRKGSFWILIFCDEVLLCQTLSTTQNFQN